MATGRSTHRSPTTWSAAISTIVSARRGRGSRGRTPHQSRALHAENRSNLSKEPAAILADPNTALLMERREMGLGSVGGETALKGPRMLALTLGNPAQP